MSEGCQWLVGGGGAKVEWGGDTLLININFKREKFTRNYTSNTNMIKITVRNKTTSIICTSKVEAVVWFNVYWSRMCHNYCFNKLKCKNYSAENYRIFCILYYFSKHAYYNNYNNYIF